VTALATLLLRDAAQAEALAGRIPSVLPKDVHAQIVELVLRTRRDSPLLLTGSVLGMIWTSSGAVGVLARSVARMYGRQRIGIVAGKLRNLGVAAALAVVIVLMMLAATAGTHLAGRLRLDVVVVRIALPVLSVAVTLIICAALYRGLSGRTLAWGPALWAGGSAQSCSKPHRPWLGITCTWSPAGHPPSCSSC
jgi:uncharacterized BrkB/YihY/UPF0761 family membrane protein